MKVDTFFQNFELLTDAPNATAKLRELILQLAVMGKLVRQDANDEPASVLLEKIKLEKENLVQQGKIKKDKPIPIEKSFELLNKIPQNWQWVKLQDVCIVITDGDHLAPPQTEIGIPLLVIGNVRNGFLDFTNTRFVPEEYFTRLDVIRVPKKGDILYTLVGSYGIPVLVNTDKPFCVQRHISIIKPSQFFNVEYLKYLLSSEMVLKQATECATGIAQKTVPLSGLRKMVVPLPPLAEQKRIVEKCDRLMSLCDEIEKQQKQKQDSIVRMNESAIAQLLSSQNPDDFRHHWERICNNFDLLYSVPETIPKLRQAILQLAVMGKLVRQDPNDEPAAVLLEKIKLEKEWLIKEKKIRKSQILPAIEIDEVAFKLPVGWEWTRLDDICSKITDGVHKTPKYTECGIPFLSVTQLKNGMLDFSNTKYISHEDHEIYYQRCNPEKGDILICKVGGTIGITTVVEVDIEFSIFVQLALIKQIIVNPYYLKFVLLSDEVQNYIKENSVGSAIPYISLEKLKYIQVPLPPLAEQKRIVEKCDRLMSLCDRLEAKLKQGRESREKLMEVAAKQVLLN
ncbi:restriction endonuclease subunit S [Anabaenopsis elenkinii]|uniref:Restriction endonuclease subunit S n=1 Tax=Anabaenopsis elenkinii CCIBt3563 TaxID=2779889 RepID=A0A7S6RDY7_9CYAN|nr:restriction endonuclease subunit S [Anabaenopsis elenkinii]QOV23182.1 restriction endonuclease subunit S [Anabaenopsis elenkinii CCIBt3563]